MSITFQKRQKELKRQEKQRAKAERREQKKFAKRAAKEALSAPTTPVFRKNLIVLGFRLPFMPPLFPVDIRGAARPGQNSLPLGDHTEFGDLKFPAPECPF